MEAAAGGAAQRRLSAAARHEVRTAARENPVARHQRVRQVDVVQTAAVHPRRRLQRPRPDGPAVGRVPEPVRGRADGDRRHGRARAALRRRAFRVRRAADRRRGLRHRDGVRRRADGRGPAAVPGPGRDGVSQARRRVRAVGQRELLFLGRGPADRTQVSAHRPRHTAGAGRHGRRRGTLVLPAARPVPDRGRRRPEVGEAQLDRLFPRRRVVRVPGVAHRLRPHHRRRRGRVRVREPDPGVASRVPGHRDVRDPAARVPDTADEQERSVRGEDNAQPPQGHIPGVRRPEEARHPRAPVHQRPVHGRQRQQKDYLLALHVRHGRGKRADHIYRCQRLHRAKILRNVGLDMMTRLWASCGLTCHYNDVGGR